MRTDSQSGNGPFGLLETNVIVNLEGLRIAGKIHIVNLVTKPNVRKQNTKMNSLVSMKKITGVVHRRAGDSG